MARVLSVQAGRERLEGRLSSRLINEERGGYLGFAMWRRYLKLAHGYAAAHKDGIVRYIATALKFPELWVPVSGFSGLITVWRHVGSDGVTGIC
jgi:hypothetical protein